MCTQPLLSTPNRFGRTSQGSYWNSGNGSPDAVCFSVDRAGIVIAGVGVYGGGGSYECDVELLDDVISLALSLSLSVCVCVCLCVNIVSGVDNYQTLPILITYQKLSRPNN